ncbi:uncharacterized protein LOC116336936 [Contarinia nasturtii]|uniref:uncharacterized protein LOC116336936 n=1 Tax=Contarinia nasturtii TaxID=265458 RepID=UPI0012D48F39|nr:uncharacterized protein LOC116336936 [Contarinia nasturtii]
MKIALIFLVISITFIVINFVQLTEAIVGYYGEAKDAKIGDIPYIALIKVLHPHMGIFMPICAGSIISKYDILTNALCASACQYPPHCKLYVGRVNVDDGGVEIQIESTVWHESYVEMDAIKTFTHTILDLGIIHTKGIPFSDNVTDIEMSNTPVGPVNNFVGYIFGWGADTDKAFKEVPKHHPILKYGKVSYFSCKAPTDRFRGICTTINDDFPEVQPAISDMGAPIIDKSSGKDKLVGVGSYYHFRYEFAPNKSTQFHSDSEQWLLYNKYFPVGENINWIKDNMSQH